MKYACIVALRLTLSVVVLYLLAAKSIEYHFANEGKIICTEGKDWGLFSKGDLKCFGLVPIVSGNEVVVTPTPKNEINGEPRLVK